MITGAHSIIYSKDAEADRVFLRDALKITNVDVGRMADLRIASSRGNGAPFGEERRA